MADVVIPRSKRGFNDHQDLYGPGKESGTNGQGQPAPKIAQRFFCYAKAGKEIRYRGGHLTKAKMAYISVRLLLYLLYAAIYGMKKI